MEEVDEKGTARASPFVPMNVSPSKKIGFKRKLRREHLHLQRSIKERRDLISCRCIVICLVATAFLVTGVALLVAVAREQNPGNPMNVSSEEDDENSTVDVMVLSTMPAYDFTYANGCILLVTRVGPDEIGVDSNMQFNLSDYINGLFINRTCATHEECIEFENVIKNETRPSNIQKFVISLNPEICGDMIDNDCDGNVDNAPECVHL